MHISEILVTSEKYRKLHAPMRLKISSVPISFCEPIDTNLKISLSDAQFKETKFALRPGTNASIFNKLQLLQLLREQLRYNCCDYRMYSRLFSVGLI